MSFKDRYNTVKPPEDENQYRKILNAQLSIAPTSVETLEQYIQKIKIHQKIARDRNWNTHVDNPFKTWHQHKNPAGCFMCNDIEFIAVLVQVLELIQDNYSSITFKH